MTSAPPIRTNAVGPLLRVEPKGNPRRVGGTKSMNDPSTHNALDAAVGPQPAPSAYSTPASVGSVLPRNGRAARGISLGEVNDG